MPYPKALARLNRLLIALWVVGSGVLALSIAQTLEDYFLPVKTDVRVMASIKDGSDVVLTTTAVKERTCEFIAPVRARSEDGVNLVVISSNPLANVTWQPDNHPQFSGPWRIVGGNGQRFSIFQEFQCHPFWRQFQDLLVVDAKGNKLKFEVVK